MTIQKERFSTMRFCLAALAIAFPFLGFSQAKLQEVWSNLQPAYNPGSAGLLIVDLDGDGTNEVVVSGTTEPSGGWRGRSHFTVLKRVDGVFRLVSRVPLARNETFVFSEMKQIPVALGQPGVFLASLQDENGGKLVVFEGPNFRRLRENVIGSRNIRGAIRPELFYVRGVKDIDADGDLEVLGSIGTNAQIRDLNSNAVVWTGAEGQQAVDAGQLDADPALEIVVSGDVGTVLDGATLAVEWTYFGGFQGRPVLGEFDGDSSTQEFAIVGASDTTTVFASSPFYSPISDFKAMQTSRSVVYDMDGDGSDELISGTRPLSEIVAYRPWSWTVAYSHANPVLGVNDLSIGELDGDSSPEIVYGGGSGSGSPAILRIIDVSSDAVEYSAFDAMGPHSNVAVADVDGDGQLEAIYGPIESAAGREGMRVSIADAATGEVLRTWTPDSTVRPFFDHWGPQLAAINLDADPQLEIVVASAFHLHPGVRVLDGLTWELQWEGLDVEGLQRPLGALGSMFFNEDEVPDLLTSGSGRLLVWDGATGELLWKTDAFAIATPNTNVLAANIDEDPALEILVQNQTTVVAFDSRTRMLEWNLSPDETTIGVSVEGINEDCRIVTYGVSKLVRRLCSTREKSSERAYSLAPATFAKAVEDSLGELVISDGKTVVLQRGNTTYATTGDLGDGIGWNNRGAILRELGGPQLLMGDWSTVRRLALDSDFVFLSGFEE